MASSDHEATLMSQYAAEEIAMLMDQNQRYENVLRQIVDPSYVGNYDDEAIVRIYREWAQAALAGTEVNE